MNIYDSIIKGSLRWPERPREAINSAVCVYLLTGEEPDLETMDRYAAGAFEMLLPILQNQRSKKVNASKPRTRRKAAKPKRADSESVSETLANDERNVSDSASQTLTIKTIPYSYSSYLSSEVESQERSSSEEDFLVSSGFTPPTVDEVRAFCAANLLDRCDPELFCAHYAAQGWLLGNGLPIADWQSLARRWHMQDRNKSASGRRMQDDFSDLAEGWNVYHGSD